MIRNIIFNLVSVFVSLVTIAYIYVTWFFNYIFNTIKKVLKYFPLAFGIFVGCSNPSESSCGESEPNLYCELPIVNGVYQLEYNQNYTQTFAPIYLNVGSQGTKKIAFASDIVVQVQGQWFDLVNTASYTSDNGTTQTTLGVFAQNVGEIINIYCGFYDDCDSHYSDHIQVEVVDNE